MKWEHLVRPFCSLDTVGSNAVHVPARVLSPIRSSLLSILSAPLVSHLSLTSPHSLTPSHARSIPLPSPLSALLYTRNTLSRPSLTLGDRDASLTRRVSACGETVAGARFKRGEEVDRRMPEAVPSLRHVNFRMELFHFTNIFFFQTFIISSLFLVAIAQHNRTCSQCLLTPCVPFLSPSFSLSS